MLNLLIQCREVRHLPTTHLPILFGIYTEHGRFLRLLARQTDGAAVQLPPKQIVIPALWRANRFFWGSFETWRN
ncbi:MAG: hypothetical protein A3J86_00790 [Anaerolinea sp. RIFOXYB12_FULL_60_12]|nr:MAG: hypothetical protein A3J86_00790 [Anaerolinea sp. RIFOXYB12_FULL_60_12]